ncbi:WAS/WASL-interacting protein family member 2-like isoform X2 [Homalodisca vitripennis]|uniref:WAS/WASL-interacting protein family member 2-like isoform X2 n=1 Tax=Homalodisca vitripennis TaxID=197043 RepID=UPI001EEBFD81|nr:WAS/WASL-interacting protein family member 2-like isoform X2 [Homalodisca vitripennis]
MPFPPPPPPPPGPPPPPSFPTSAPQPVSAEGRNLLLQSIRQGTTLKKAVTNDKSAPAISGSVRPSSSSSSSGGSGGGSPRSNGGINGSATLGRSNGLAGLFAGGMPRLKPTGVDIGQNNSQSLTSLPSATAPGQEPTRRQFNVDIKNRGPPPKPPPSNQKPTMPQDGSILEMRAKLKQTDRKKSFSSDSLVDYPALPRPLVNSSAVTPLSPRPQVIPLSPRPQLKPLSPRPQLNPISVRPPLTLLSPRPQLSSLAQKSPNLYDPVQFGSVGNLPKQKPSFTPPPLPARKSPQTTTPRPVSSYTPSSTSPVPKPNEANTTVFRFPPLSINNFPNARTPPPLVSAYTQTTPQSPSVFKFPQQFPSKQFNSFGTLPVRISPLAKGTDTTRSEKVSSRRPIVAISPTDTSKPSMYEPPQTPGRNEYNRYRDSSMKSPGYLPPLPTSPRPKPTPTPMTLPQIEFKIQRPQLSETSSTSTSDSVLTGPLHNRSSSTTSLHTNNTGSWTQPIPRVAMKAPPGGHGKPNVAPKPPGIAAKSPGKLTNGRSGVTRAQSMRAPRSPPVAPPTGQMSLLPNQSELYKGAPMFHQSQDSLLHTPPPPKHHTLPSPRAVPPHRPPLRPPQTKPPPPPPNKVMMMSPPCPPPPPPTQAPPPPTQAPPPPPHRVPLQPPRIPPLSASLSPAPPPPPARHSSMRNGLPSSFSSKLEARFAERFHMREEFPPPQVFLNVTKMYNSRTAKQPAPQPPHHIQLNWSHDSASTC